MKILKNNEIDGMQWQELLDSSPTKSFFQSKTCYDFYTQLSFLTPFAIAVAENDKLQALVCGYIVAEGGKIKQYFSRRAIIPAGILLANKVNEKYIVQLLAELKMHLARKAIYTEIRNYNDYAVYTKLFQHAGFTYYPHLNFHLDSFESDNVMNNLKSNKRRYLKNSLKAGANYSITTDKSEINELFRILQILYKTKIKTPLFPAEFFQKLSLIENSVVFVVKLNERIIGGSVFVMLPKVAIYEWFVCGEDKMHKGVYPSILATWAGIEFASKNEIPLFDFMGAGKPDVEYGVRDFKAEFGGKLVEHGRFLSVQSKIRYALGVIYVKLMKQ